MMEQTTKQTLKAGGVAGWAIAVLQRGRRNLAARKRDRTLEVLETISLGSKRDIALVSCNGQQFLVGMGTEGVTTIVPVDCRTNLQQGYGFPPEARERAASNAAESSQSSRSMFPLEVDTLSAPRSFPLARPRDWSQELGSGQ